MEVDLANDSEQLIQSLGDGIERLERTLTEDESFCNKDIDATYQAALNYFKAFQESFNKKLDELKKKLDQLREENAAISKQNSKQFNDEIDEINNLFSSGKHQEALQKFQDYEKNFEQRTTVITKIPKLFMKNIDIQQYFSFDKPLHAPQTLSIDNRQNSSDHVAPVSVAKPSFYLNKPTEADSHTIDDDENNENESHKPPKHLNSQRSLPTNLFRNKEITSPSTSVLPRFSRISTRLTSSPSSKSQLGSDNDNATPPILASNTSSHRMNTNNYRPVQTAPPELNTNSPLGQRQTTPMKTSKEDNLTSMLVTHFEHVRDTFVLMASNEDCIIIGRSRSNQLYSWTLSSIDRSNRDKKSLNWNNNLITSIGFINRQTAYIFSERYFLTYSMPTFSTLGSWILVNESTSNSELNIQHCGIGTVYDKCIYHVYLNSKYQWILSIFELETIRHLYDYDLTENFSDIKRFIHICVNDRYVSFLVEIDGSRYAVIFCARNNYSLQPLKQRIVLVYTGNPLTICSIYIYSLRRYIYFINDPSAKIIHLITNDKYLKSCTIIAHAFSYIPENSELLYVSNDGIYSIKIDEQSMFSKFR